jgi:cystathionine beta-synthase
MFRDFPVVAPTLGLDDLVAMLESTPYVAVSQDGTFHGLITRADVLNYLRRQMTAAPAH